MSGSSTVLKLGVVVALGRVAVVGFSSYIPAHVRGCERLRRLRSIEGKYIGWSTYITAALKRYGGKGYEAALVILPSWCKGKYRLYVKDFDVEVLVHEYPVRRLVRNIYEYRSYSDIALDVLDLLRSFDAVILHTQDLFSVPFMRELIHLFPRLKSASSNIYIVSQQQSFPPFMYYHEARGFLKGLALGLPGEIVYRTRRNLIDGYIVMNKKTFRYLVDEVAVEKSRIIYQHDGIDYERINPDRFKEDDKVRSGSRLGCKYRLVVVAHVTRSFGGYTKGVDILPVVQDRLRKSGYPVCITVIGDIIDTDLAARLHDAGVELTGYMDHMSALRLISNADLYILPARRRRYYGGITVAVIEAMALNVPVVSPTLEHVPVTRYIKYMGVMTPWLDEKHALDRFIDAVIYALDNKSSFKPREYSRMFYDVRVMVRNIERLYDRILYE